MLSTRIDTCMAIADNAALLLGNARRTVRRTWPILRATPESWVAGVRSRTPVAEALEDRGWQANPCHPDPPFARLWSGGRRHGRVVPPR